MSTDILLTTANARYSHCAFGLLRLWSALGTLRSRARVMEFTLQQGADEMAEALLRDQPSIIGLGVYIWNVDLMARVMRIIKRVRPDIWIVLGGPEITVDSRLIEEADFAVVGEGEIAFAGLADRLLNGDVPAEKVLVSEPTVLDALPCPYDAYTDEDIRHRLLYVESSRGCPMRCAFCLSSRDAHMRYFPLPPFLNAMERLLERGARQFKFTDRTFNVCTSRMHAILQFFLDRAVPDMRLHFEIMPDQLGEETLKRMALFASGQLHLEAGLQSVREATQRAIGRFQNVTKSLETIRRLRNETGAVLHADLLVGLPGDEVGDVAAGFDALVAAGVQEIQVGLLKCLPGAPIAARKDLAMQCDPHAPYEVLCTSTLSFECIQELKRLARYFDRYYNRGQFTTSLPMLWADDPSPFNAFKGFADYLWTREKRTHHIPLARMAENLYEHLVMTGRFDAEQVAAAIAQDFYRLAGRRDKLAFLAR